MTKYDLEKEIADLKEARLKMTESFKIVDVDKNNKLADYFFNKFRKGEDITFALLNEMEVGVPMPLPVVHGGAIMTTREIVSELERLCYKTKWTAGATLTWHYHSDCNEVLEVTKGSAKVYVKGQVLVLIPGQKLEIAAGVGHQVTALEASEMTVDFYKVSKVTLQG